MFSINPVMNRLGKVLILLVYISVTRRVMHFSIYMSLSMTTNTTPLSAVRIMQVLSFFRFCEDSLSSLVMLDLGAFDLATTYMTLV